MSSATSSLAEFIEKSPEIVHKASKKAAKAASHAAKVAKVAKKIIESFTQSDNKLTESFTDHSISTVTEKVSNVTMILTKVKDVLNNPKVKWVFLAVLLCVAALLYFRMQKKQSDKKPKDAHNLNVINENNGRPELVQLPQPPVFQQPPQPQFDMAAVERALRERIENEMRERVVQENIKRNLPVPESESSEEVFIEDENVLNHNLTAEEMNAIDRQLEDVNLDNLMNN